VFFLQTNFKGHTVWKAGPKPHFGNEKLAQSQAVAAEKPSSATYSYSQEKDHIRQTIKKIDAKIHEGKVRSVRKLSKSKIYLNGLSQKLESGNTYLSPCCNCSNVLYQTNVLKNRKLLT
jgi:hypothetical protein